jgi:hypothetical protein
MADVRHRPHMKEGVNLRKPRPIGTKCIHRCAKKRMKVLTLQIAKPYNPAQLARRSLRRDVVPLKLITFIVTKASDCFRMPEFRRLSGSPGRWNAAW